MLKLSPRIALPLLAAVTVVALAAFAPGPATTPAVEAACGAHYSGYWLSSQWETCDTWDFWCWVDPSQPDNVNILHQRWCRHKYDEAWRYCGTECYDGEIRRGCCKPR